jgi:hypothetical protein
MPSSPAICCGINGSRQSIGSVSFILSFPIFHRFSAAIAHGSCHQHKGMNGDLIFAGRPLEKGQIGFVVFLAVKAGLPIIATLNHVMSVTGKIKAG